MCLPLAGQAKNLVRRTGRMSWSIVVREDNGLWRKVLAHPRKNIVAQKVLGCLLRKLSY